MNIKLVIEYHGGAFFGWQKQNGVRSVQEDIESAITKYLRSEFKKSRASLEDFEQNFPVLSASGRTDSGVHARAQIANFTWPDHIQFDQYRFLKSINSLISDKISILSAEVVPFDFHARKSALSKTYSYRILHRLAPSALDCEFSWHIRSLSNYEQMISSAKLFIGAHDFKCFRASDCNAKSTVREIFSSNFIEDKYQILRYEVCGTGFLKNQVRFMVGAIVAVGKGKLESNQILNMLAGLGRPNFDLAPAKGLCLESVQYGKE